MEIDLTGTDEIEAKLREFFVQLKPDAWGYIKIVGKRRIIVSDNITGKRKFVEREYKWEDAVRRSIHVDFVSIGWRNRGVNCWYDPETMASNITREITKWQVENIRSYREEYFG